MRKVFLFKCQNFIFCSAMLLSSCSYPIRYSLNDKEIVKAHSRIPLNVQVALFEDQRPEIERQFTVRKEKRKINAEDYTYDRGFKGQVNEAITAMLVKHLAYAKIFNSVTMGSFSSDQVTDEALNKLSKNGVDAVLAGELHHFYGFYDYHIYKQFGYSLLLATVFSIPVAIATT